MPKSGKSTAWWIAPLLLTTMSAGCTPATSIRPALPSVAAAPDPRWQTLLQSAAQQVRRCYRGPRVSHSGRQIVTRLRVFVAPDGLIAGRPAVIAQNGVTPVNRIYAERMAEAAIDAVLRCAPLRIPQGFAGGSAFEIDLTFSPSASA